MTSIIRVQNIQYTDGDSAITIADGGGITLPQTVTVSGNIELGHATDTTLSRSAAGTLQVEGKSVLTTGHEGAIIQTKQTVMTGRFETTSTSFTDITGLSVAITPTTATNKILIMVHLQNNATYTYAKFFNLVRGSTNILQGDAHLSSQTRSTVYSRDEAFGEVSTVIFLDSPGATSEQTYKMQGSVQSGGELTINYTQVATNAAYIGTGTSTITAMEVVDNG